MSTIYERRVEQEWRLLQSLAETNPEVVRIESRHAAETGVAFQFELLKTSALLQHPDGRSILESHKVNVRFPRFFPSIPIEVSLVQPVFHPNVHPENGFVCLWDRFSPGDTVIEAVSRLQRVITWQLVNREADHLMQPAALEWFDSPARSRSLPLPCQRVHKPEGLALAQSYRTPPQNIRRRLS
jgi:ubiquitin-protein ligase